MPAPRTAEAGHYGKEIRSDAHVAVEPRDGGGVQISMQSRVAPYYGDAITAQAREMLETMGVKNAQVSIHDEGALPFVISARIETAINRSGLGTGKKVLPEKAALPEPSPKDRLRRSRLYVPGSEPKYFINAALHGPDAVILDLEDSVHQSEKDSARILVRNALRNVNFGPASGWYASTSCRSDCRILPTLFRKHRISFLFRKSSIQDKSLRLTE